MNRGIRCAVFLWLLVVVVARVICTDSNNVLGSSYSADASHLHNQCYVVGQCLHIYVINWSSSDRLRFGILINARRPETGIPPNSSAPSCVHQSDACDFFHLPPATANEAALCSPSIIWSLSTGQSEYIPTLQYLSGMELRPCHARKRIYATQNNTVVCVGCST